MLLASMVEGNLEVWYGDCKFEQFLVDDRLGDY
jgi:hypothetical protein